MTPEAVVPFYLDELQAAGYEVSDALPCTGGKNTTFDFEGDDVTGIITASRPGSGFGE